MDNPEALILTVFLKSIPIEFVMLPARVLFDRIIRHEIDVPKVTAINRVRQEIQEKQIEYQGKIRTLKKEKGERIKNDLSKNKIENIL